MTFDYLKEKFIDRDPAFPKGFPEPNQNDLDKIIEKYNCRFSQSFIDFQLKYCHEVSIGDFAYEGFGWANCKLEPYMNLDNIVKNYKSSGYPDYLSPFRIDNGDFYCFDNRKPSNDGEFPVVILDHNTENIEKDTNYQWTDFLDWLDKTMID